MVHGKGKLVFRASRGRDQYAEIVVCMIQLTKTDQAGPTFRPSSLRRFLGDGVLCGAEQNADLPDDGDSEANRLRSTGLPAF